MKILCHVFLFFTITGIIWEDCKRDGKNFLEAALQACSHGV